ncbi:MAG: EFR1 family ferrodoxin [Firmicutes bacterium]|nr:EFR1 family ferrodoxin [Bacillota bacterium]
MLTLYFSATGNTEYIARVFSREMGAACLSIEADHNFTAEIKAHGTVAFCYPIYGSRVPRNMREFAAKHMSDLNGKKIIIFVTQMLFSGDGARVFTDMFWDGFIDVIYAEHFILPNNVCNIPIFRKRSNKSIIRSAKKAEAKMIRVCNDIKSGVVKKRGFSRFSQFLGNLQGKAWQGDSREVEPRKLTVEHKAKSGVKIHKNCTACNLCMKICPVKNLANDHGKIIHQGNCIVCYRCVNRCPQRAITVTMLHLRPKWQYKGIDCAVNGD